MNPFVEDERDHFPDLEDFHKVLAEKNEEGALIMDCIEMRSLQGCMDFNTIPGSPPDKGQQLWSFPVEEQEQAETFFQTLPEKQSSTAPLVVLYDPATDSFPEEPNMHVGDRRHSVVESTCSETASTPSPGSRKSGHADANRSPGVSPAQMTKSPGMLRLYQDLGGVQLVFPPEPSPPASQRKRLADNTHAFPSPPRSSNTSRQQAAALATPVFASSAANVHASFTSPNLNNNLNSSFFLAASPIIASSSHAHHTHTTPPSFYVSPLNSHHHHQASPSRHHHPQHSPSLHHMPCMPLPLPSSSSASNHSSSMLSTAHIPRHHPHLTLPCTCSSSSRSCGLCSSSTNTQLSPAANAENIRTKQPLCSSPVRGQGSHGSGDATGGKASQPAECAKLTPDRSHGFLSRQRLDHDAQSSHQHHAHPFPVSFSPISTALVQGPASARLSPSSSTLNARSSLQPTKRDTSNTHRASRVARALSELSLVQPTSPPPSSSADSAFNAFPLRHFSRTELP